MKTENLALYTDEREVIEKIVNGENALFEVLIRRTNATLYKLARVHGFNHQDSEDLMQETHIAAFQNLSSFQFRSSYKTWISKIMIHKCLYKIKYGYNSKELNELINENAHPMQTSDSSAEKLVAMSELNRILENCIQELPVHYRSVFVLREIEGYSVAETADLLSLTDVNVKVRLSRAKSMMQKELEKFYTRADIYAFHLSYCDALTEKVMKQIPL